MKGGAALEKEQRLENFEKMLGAILNENRAAEEKLRILKESGKEKSATFRQLLGNRLQFQKILSYYKAYGLIDGEEK